MPAISGRVPSTSTRCLGLPNGIERVASAATSPQWRPWQEAQQERRTSSPDRSVRRTALAPRGAGGGRAEPRQRPQAGAGAQKPCDEPCRATVRAMRRRPRMSVAAASSMLEAAVVLGPADASSVALSPHPVVALVSVPKQGLEKDGLCLRRFAHYIKSTDHNATV